MNDRLSKSESIKLFLTKFTHKHLSDLYSIEMECQVNVCKGDGEIVKGEYKGRKWLGYTDGLTTWKSFRIPYNAMSNPEYTDSKMNFDLAEHVEGIGLTGWNWYRKESKWVAFDFDSLVSHSKGLTQIEIKEIIDSLSNIPFVTILKSTSGQGIHIYVFLKPVETSNHNEHSALARSVLGKLSALSGTNLQSKVDCCGGNMWVWHRKMKNTSGLSLIKKGCELKDVPLNWRDHIPVIRGTHTRVSNKKSDVFTLLTNSKHRVKLDEEHKRLINYLEESNSMWWWDSDNNMLVTHTIHLKDASKALNLKGHFDTISTGKEKGTDHNCFLFPMENGVWSVRRYTLGVEEHPSWDQDSSGWTRTYFNKDMDLRRACKSSGGLEDPTTGKDGGGFVFDTAKNMIEALDKLNTKIKIDYTLDRRKARIKKAKDGRLIVEVSKNDSDKVETMPTWLPKKDKFIKVLNFRDKTIDETELSNSDNLIRHLITEDLKDIGWCLYSDGEWRHEPLQNVRLAMASLNYNSKDINNILGSSVRKCWKLVNKPFQPEYTGNREWNKDGAKFKFIPTTDKDDLEYPTWNKILMHCGKGLDYYIKNDKWCKINGIQNGGDYLKCWIASMFQFPFEPLPYLFFYGKQKSGKTVFYESLSLLLTKGYKKSDLALKSKGDFNSELEGAILCVLDEVDLKRNKDAYNKIKDWVTAAEIVIHKKGIDRYQIKNTTHWVQCGNSHLECPIFSGDTRITMCHVESLDPLSLIPRKRLFPLLEKEASDFLAYVLNLEIPDSKDRLNVPIISTPDKQMVQETNETLLETFISTYCKESIGYLIKFSNFYGKFLDWIDFEDKKTWSKIRVSRELPPEYPRGRYSKDGQFYIGNIAWKSTNTDKKMSIIMKKNDSLVRL